MAAIPTGQDRRLWNDPARAIVPPPRLRAKRVGFSAPLLTCHVERRLGPGEAGRGERGSADPCTTTSFLGLSSSGRLVGPFLGRPVGKW